MNTLIVVAHPDDELLGPGPLLFDLAAKGSVAFFCYTENSLRHGLDPTASLNSLARVAGNFGAEHRSLGLSDQRLDKESLIDLTKPLEAFIAQVKPALVLTHLAEDLNRDHRIVNEAVQVACRGGISVAEFSTVSSSEHTIAAWKSNWFIPVTDTAVEGAWELFKKNYPQEVNPYPHPRSSEAYKAFYAAQGLVCRAPYSVNLKLVSRWGL